MVLRPGTDGAGFRRGDAKPLVDKAHEPSEESESDKGTKGSKGLCSGVGSGIMSRWPGERERERVACRGIKDGEWGYLMVWMPAFRPFLFFWKFVGALREGCWFCLLILLLSSCGRGDDRRTDAGKLIQRYD